MTSLWRHSHYNDVIRRCLLLFRCWFYTSKNNQTPCCGWESGISSACPRFATSTAQQASLWIANLGPSDEIPSSLQQRADRFYYSYFTGIKSERGTNKSSLELLRSLRDMFVPRSDSFPMIHSLWIQIKTTHFWSKLKYCLIHDEMKMPLSFAIRSSLTRVQYPKCAYGPYR